MLTELTMFAVRCDSCGARAAAALTPAAADDAARLAGWRFVLRWTGNRYEAGYDLCPNCEATGSPQSDANAPTHTNTHAGAETAHSARQVAPCGEVAA